MLHVRIWLMAAMLFGIAASDSAAEETAQRRPNVVIFLSDDQGWGDLSVHGNRDLATPNIDSLARDGALFDRFFVCPVCSPTRAEFLTGRYHPRGGVYGVSTGAERLDLDERTIAEVFQAAGYATGAFGKWHNGMQSPYHPNDRGFDEYYGFCSGHWGNYFSPQLDHNGQLVEGDGYIIDDFTNHALEFIEQNKDQPFFCYLPYCTPHSPMQVPDEFWSRFNDKELQQRERDPENDNVDHARAALAMCENIDWNVGRVLRKLDELQLADNTIVLYFSDNGPNGWRWNGGMKGRKGSVDEGGVRVPLLVRWPGQIQPGTRVTEIAGAIDLLPTLVGLAGIGADLPQDKPLDGRNLQPLLSSEDAHWPDRVLVSHWNGKLSARSQQYRLDDQGQLFDMVSDPGQQKGIAAERPDVVRRLTAVLHRYREEVLGELQVRDRPFTVGYSKTTPLPARDGVPHGNVKRSAGAPNCSFFTNWTSEQDRITWDIEVAESGRYEAVVHYTCEADDVGSVIELSSGADRLKCEINEAHDPPLNGAEQDRVPRRGESYVKDFRPLRLGTLQLEKGRTTLSLQALKIPGDEVIDVRYVMLTREAGE